MSLPVFTSDDERNYTVKWAVLTGKKHWRLFQRWTEHNCHNHRNIFCTEGGKRKTTKGISRCYGYHETCRWHLWRGVGERLYSVQKMDQPVIQQKILGPPQCNKITQRQMQKVRRILLILRSRQRLLTVASMSFREGISRLSRSLTEISMFEVQKFFYFSVVKILLESVTLVWATAPSRLNT